MFFEPEIEEFMGAHTTGLCSLAVAVVGAVLINYAYFIAQPKVLEAIGIVAMTTAPAGMLFYCRYHFQKLFSKWAKEAPHFCRALIKVSWFVTAICWAVLSFKTMRGTAEDDEKRTYISAEDMQRIRMGWLLLGLIFVSEYSRSSAKSALRAKEAPLVFQSLDKRSAIRIFAVLIIFVGKVMFAYYYTYINSSPPPLETITFAIFGISYVIASEILDDIRTFMVRLNMPLAIILNCTSTIMGSAQQYLREQRIKENNPISRPAIRVVTIESMIFALFGMYFIFEQIEQALKVSEAKKREEKREEEKKALRTSVDSVTHSTEKNGEGMNEVK